MALPLGLRFPLGLACLRLHALAWIETGDCGAELSRRQSWRVHGPEACGRHTRGNLTDEAYNDARDHYVAAAHAVAGYLRTA